MELKAGKGAWPGEEVGTHSHKLTWTPEVTRKVASLAVMLS